MSLKPYGTDRIDYIYEQNPKILCNRPGMYIWIMFSRLRWIDPIVLIGGGGVNTGQGVSGQKRKTKHRTNRHTRKFINYPSGSGYT